MNRGTRFCRPLRNHSATWPYVVIISGLFGSPEMSGEPLLSNLLAHHFWLLAPIFASWNATSRRTAASLFIESSRDLRDRGDRDRRVARSLRHRFRMHVGHLPREFSLGEIGHYHHQNPEGEQYTKSEWGADQQASVHLVVWLLLARAPSISGGRASYAIGKRRDCGGWDAIL